MWMCFSVLKKLNFTRMPKYSGGPYYRWKSSLFFRVVSWCGMVFCREYVFQLPDETSHLNWALRYLNPMPTPYSWSHSNTGFYCNGASPVPTNIARSSQPAGKASASWCLPCFYFGKSLRVTALIYNAKRECFVVFPLYIVLEIYGVFCSLRIFSTDPGSYIDFHPGISNRVLLQITGGHDFLADDCRLRWCTWLESCLSTGKPISMARYHRSIFTVWVTCQAALLEVQNLPAPSLFPLPLPEFPTRSYRGFPPMT